MRLRCLGFLLVAACGGGGGFPDAPVPDAAETGTFSLAWSVVDQDNAPLPCGRIAAQSMTVLAHDKQGFGGSSQGFTCKDGAGTSGQVPIGLYDIDFELSGTFGLLAQAPSQMSVAIHSNQDTQLDPVTFQVQATGGVALQLDSGNANGNCAPTANGGAGIEQFTITVERTSDLTCAPLTLNISQGATRPAGTYTVNCNMPVVTGCIEADQVLTATGVDSDGYTLHIKGKIQSKDCYLNDDSIQVPPLDITLSRTLNLVQQTQVSGCG